MGWSGVGWGEVEWDGVGRNGVRCGGVRWGGMGQNGGWGIGGVGGQDVMVRRDLLLASVNTIARAVSHRSRAALLTNVALHAKL